MHVKLTGFRHSVYTRSARIALGEKGVAADYTEADPFGAEGLAALEGLHPFGRVPVLEHDGFRLYETVAILRYVDEAFDGPALMPEGAAARARAVQAMSIVDAYVYGPLVRQAFSHGVYRPLMGEAFDAGLRDEGLAAAPRALDALEAIAAEGLVLRPGTAGLAEGHLFPMLDYFAMLDAGREMIAARPALGRWFEAMGARDAVRRTRPDLEGEEG